MTEQQELTEQFIYPKNALLRKSYQAIIQAVLERRRIVFRPESLAIAICNYHGWPDDSNIDIDKPSGQNFKKALNILRTFEGKFTKPLDKGLGLEVFVFKTNGARVSTFDALERLCSLDIDMSEVVATTARLDLNQKWNDKFVPDCLAVEISAEVAAADSAMPMKIDTLDAVVAEKPSSFKAKRKGMVKGSELAPDELEAVKLSSSGIFDELLAGDVPPPPPEITDLKTYINSKLSKIEDCYREGSTGNEGKLKTPLETKVS